MKSTSVQCQSIHSINGAIGNISMHVLLNLHDYFLVNFYIYQLNIFPFVTRDENASFNVAQIQVAVPICGSYCAVPENILPEKALEFPRVGGRGKLCQCFLLCQTKLGQLIGMALTCTIFPILNSLIRAINSFQKWNGKFQLEYFDQNKWTTSRGTGNPGYSETQIKRSFPFEFRLKFLESLA